MIIKFTFKKYRIVTDCYGGYEVQRWRLWFPFWIQVGLCNTFVSVRLAEEFIERGCKYETHKKEIVKIIKEYEVRT